MQNIKAFHQAGLAQLGVVAPSFYEPEGLGGFEVFQGVY